MHELIIWTSAIASLLGLLFLILDKISQNKFPNSGVLIITLIGAVIAIVLYLTNPPPGPPDPPDPVDIYATNTLSGSNLAIRESPSENSTIIIEVPYGARVVFLEAGLNPDTIQSVTTDWWRVKYNEIEGYCISSNLEFLVSDSPPIEANLPLIKNKEKYYEYTKRVALLGVKSKIRKEIKNTEVPEHSILYFFDGEKKILPKDLADGIKLSVGTTLEFVLSTNTIGKVMMPKITCHTYDEAAFLLANLSLKLGKVNLDSTLTDNSKAYVYRQKPAYQPGLFVKIGSTVDLYLTANRPLDCIKR